MLAVICGLAIFGIVLNFIDLERFKVLSMVCCVGMGWLAMLIFKKIRYRGINKFSGNRCLRNALMIIYKLSND